MSAHTLQRDACRTAAAEWVPCVAGDGCIRHVVKFRLWVRSRLADGASAWVATDQFSYCLPDGRPLAATSDTTFTIVPGGEKLHRIDRMPRPGPHAALRGRPAPRPA